ncbi:MAG: hypothetical protein DDT32_01006 [Syntrophomonadaceae bacterium]|nr:hypothetical protein [Bacillota bacterium]
MQEMWKFKELETGMPERDPRETEFFRPPKPSEALVREIIQNSLDAKRNDEPWSQVRFTFGSVKRGEIDEYLDGLIPHLAACEFNLPDLTREASLHFLTIEDFGTTGLDGATGEGATRPEKGTSNFFDFWWREGISGKKETRAGRWGLGKTTFHITSRIRTFWGYTIRYGDSRILLMGKTLLKTHNIGNTGYQYYGYFTGDDYKPISDNRIIEDFRRRFSISRGNEHGLSLTVPLPDGEITRESVLRSVIIHYFFPLAKGTLEVEIRDNGNSLTVKSDNLIQVAVSQKWSGTSWENVNVRELLQFVFGAILGSRVIDIRPLNPEKPEITEETFDNTFNSLRESFNAGNLITFRIYLSIKKVTETQSVFTYFMVHLKKTSDLRGAEEFWIRSGIRISDIQTLGNRPVRALVVAEDSPVATFLGDAETPAHTDWKENTEGFKEKYQDAARILRFIKRSVSKIVSLLDQPPEEIQRDFLNEIFFVPAIQENEEQEDITKKPKPPIERKIPVFLISPISGGFNISLNPKKQDVSLPLHATVVAAHDVRRGNPFKQYEPYDFDFGNSSWPINAEGCSILNRERNKIETQVTSPDFSLRVTGFDPNRDLVAKVTEG